VIDSKVGTPEWIRTTDLLLRRQTLNAYIAHFSTAYDLYERELRELIAMLSRLHKTTFANASGSGHAPLIVLIVPYCSSFSVALGVREGRLW
jgi:hypothetical protein